MANRRLVQGLTAAGIILGVGLFGCASEQPTAVTLDASADPAAAPGDSINKKKVLTTFTILADMAQVVAGEALVVESITRIGAEIH
ncbi:MAG: metal ABC transporter substrate-binding protein, partial [Cyanobacteria bacterium]|nr:metal ABC transporter substrate-binding protein [Cyanobacteriota bacterium]